MYIPFHLKKALYGFCLAYLNCQHDYSCTLGPLFSKIRVTRTQALQYCDSQSENLRSYQVSRGQAVCMQHGDPGQKDESSRGGWSSLAQDFIMLLRAAQLKTYELFISGIWLFPDYCWPWMSETMESKTLNEVGLLHTDCHSENTSW